jgi:CRP/FNR family cyclic AMP-dependent transcriptional regulator
MASVPKVGLMQRVMNLEVEKDGTVTDPLPCDSLLEDFLGFGDIKLSSTHRRGAILFAEGQPAVGIHVLCAGRAKLSISSAGGKTAILRIAQPGDLLGVNSVLKGLPYEATVETLERCRIDFVPRADFIKLLDKSKAVRVGVSKVLGNEVNELVERARLLLLSQSAREKLARLLLKWFDELGEQTAKGTRLNHGLTHEEIGQMIGASRETVSRLFTELRRKQIVLLNGTGIFVRNRAALEVIVR